jgi:hypothetical protein
MLSKRGGFMPVTLPIEVYEVFEKGFGKEDAKKVVKSLEAVIGDEVVNKWHQTKEELKNELLKEVATKAELENVRLEILGRIDKDKAELLGRIDSLYEKTEKDKAELLGIMRQNKEELLGIMKQDKAELLGRIDALYEKTEKDKAELLGIMKQDKAELLGKIEIEITRLDRKFTIMFVILFFTIIFLNQNALEFLAKVLGLVR